MATVYIVWSGSQKVHPYTLATYAEAIEWKNKVNAQGFHASIEELQVKDK